MRHFEQFSNNVIVWIKLTYRFSWGKAILIRSWSWQIPDEVGSIWGSMSFLLKRLSQSDLCSHELGKVWNSLARKEFGSIRNHKACPDCLLGNQFDHIRGWEWCHRWRRNLVHDKHKSHILQIWYLVIYLPKIIRNWICNFEFFALLSMTFHLFYAEKAMLSILENLWNIEVRRWIMMLNIDFTA